MITKLMTGCAVLCSVAATAQTNADTADHLDGEHVINEVVVTGQYTAGSADKAVHKIRVIDRKKIDAMSAQTLRDVLTNDMNIRISQDNVLGSSMSMQGISGEHVKILIDGVPVIGRQDGNIDLSQISLSNIERIEIVEGPMSVSYGTDALAGTINLITKKTQKNFIETGLSTYYETIGNYNATARVGMHKGRHTVSISGGRNFFDGWNNGDKIAIDFAPHIADSTRSQLWKPREQYFADLMYSYKTKNTTINYKGSLFNELITNRGVPRLPYYENAFDDYYRTARTDNAVFVTSELRNRGNINFMAAYNDYKRTKNTYYNDLTTLDRSLSTNSGDQDTSKFHSIESRGTYSTNKTDIKINYEAGYDINVSDATGQRIKNELQTIGDYAVFASAEYRPIAQLTIRPGVRYGYNTAYNAPVIPSLNLRYKINSALMVRASYAKGFRGPALKELYFDFVDINHNIHGNETLKAEHSDNYSLSAVYSRSLTNVNYKAEGTVFYNNINDLITLAQSLTGTDYTYINRDKYKTKGIQANAEIGIGNIKISVGGSYMGTYNQLSEVQGVAAFSYSPEARVNLFYELKKYGMTAALFYKYTGRTAGFLLDANNQVQPLYISDFHTADVSVSKTVFSKRLTITIGSKNLFDVKNIISSGGSGGVHSTATNSLLQSCGRTYFIKTDLNLKKK